MRDMSIDDARLDDGDALRGIEFKNRLTGSAR